MKDGKPKYKTILLHRYLTDAKRGEYVDHKNHVVEDNTDDNIRKISNSDNTKNRKGKNKNNTSGYRNISYDKKGDKWMVQLQDNGKHKTWAFSSDELEKAIEFRNKTRTKLYGEFQGEG